jgi:hypothetical protein
MASSSDISIFDFDICFLCALERNQLEALKDSLRAHLATLPVETLDSHRCFESIIKIMGILSFMDENVNE